MKKKNGILTLLIVVIITFGMMVGVKFLLADNGQSSSGGYVPGEYIGTGEGMHGPLSVKVTFSETEILSVEIVEHNDTPGVCEYAIEYMPGKIINAQTYDVDAVSGVTLTSNGIKEAVKDAMQQAAK